MATTTIRTTCQTCQLTTDIPSARLVLTLPASTADQDVEPTILHLCPGCRACNSATISWRNAVYLLDAGTTAIAAPDGARIRPHYPERRPGGNSPMTLDDLIDLHAALNSDAPAL